MTNQMALLLMQLARKKWMLASMDEADTRRSEYHRRISQSERLRWIGLYLYYRRAWQGS